MFDIGFWELAIIGVVALLVVGPDRLPGLARDVGRWVGRIRRFVTSVRSDIEQELRADEIKKMLQDQEREINRLRTMMDETGRDIRRDVNLAADSLSGTGSEEDGLKADPPRTGETEAAHKPSGTQKDG